MIGNQGYAAYQHPAGLAAAALVNVDLMSMPGMATGLCKQGLAVTP